VAGNFKERFAALICLPDEDIDLGLGALLIAGEEYPDLDHEPYLRQLDEMGGQAAARLSPDMSAKEQVEALAQLLAVEHGFRGNEDDYYDPRNSFLNDVLERRTGIPITLATVYIEVGQRAGLDVAGVGFPTHFLARLGDVVFDPFREGRIVGEDDCRQLLAEASDGQLTFEPAYLEPTPTKQMLVRMLNNLKAIYLRSRYYRKALGIMDRLLLAEPKNYRELRDRGAVWAELKQFGQAKADLEEYLQHSKEDAAAVRQAIRNMDNLMMLMDE
jgi:regulator of sirC expression with transglutaminase-like and TPR domain